MPRLYLFAEGATELTFAGTMLKPHLAHFGLYMQPPVLIANARKKGRIHRGGGSKYGPMKKDILRFLRQEKGEDVFFTTMIDLYGIHGDFPSLVEAERLRHSPEKRVETLEQAFARDIGDGRFVPYIQLHEYESYLFSDPKWFEYFYDHHEKQIATLKAIADQHATPELIDDGAHSAPSKRIIEMLPDYEGAKAAAGQLSPDDRSLESERLRGIALSHRDWLMAEGARAGLRAQWRELFASFDAVICPLMPTPAYPHDHSPEQEARRVRIDDTDRVYPDQLAWPGIATLPGLPATAIPLGLSPEGLPVGVQIVGPWLEDRTPLKLAELIEREFGGFVPPPMFDD